MNFKRCNVSYFHVDLVWFMKSPTNGGFFWSGRSASDVDPVVSSYTRPYGHFTGGTKNKQRTNRGWKEKADKLQNFGGEVRNF